MGKTKSTREGNGGDMGAAGSSLRAAVGASELRKRKRAAETKKRTPPRSERGRRGETASRPAREDRRSGRRRSRPATRTPRGVRPPLPPPPPLRLLPRPAPLRGSVLANIRRRPASAVDEGEGGITDEEKGPERWLWAKKWKDRYESEGGWWILRSISLDDGMVKENWEWLDAVESGSF